MESRKITVANNILLPDVVLALRQGDSATIRAKGNSMLPFIVGEVDLIELKAEVDYRKNDIVLTEIQPGSFILHRILQINDGVITLMGDGNVIGKEQCRRSDIAGRATKIIRGDKTILLDTKRQKHLSSLWRFLHPTRRYLLWIYRKTILKQVMRRAT